MIFLLKIGMVGSLEIVLENDMSFPAFLLPLYLLCNRVANVILMLSTLQSLIDAQAGINAQGGKQPNFNKHSGWNKCTGLKNNKHSLSFYQKLQSSHLWKICLYSLFNRLYRQILFLYIITEHGQITPHLLSQSVVSLRLQMQKVSRYTLQ